MYRFISVCVCVPFHPCVCVPFHTFVVVFVCVFVCVCVFACVCECFMQEAESLLTVNANASYDRMKNAATARSLLHTLHTETSIFNSKEPPPERYLFILDRLIYLDAADDFVAKARRFYPPRDEDEEEDKAINLPLLLSRVKQSLNAGDDDEEEEGDMSGQDD
ncbi:hypothetical protein QTP70_009343 [Hemibagrus guttatus]|uniref:Uncharacterized protein n=1 Tax=Hemibagrus guttatus TaxID=175788 RepID=A0AAE0UMS8_9TELE|nr:hypothetical protein QTP70_009343 [Hemibagrus guttatus]